jgi:glucose-1-phosphate adenylyltransferase
MGRTITVVLGGGRGSRLYPLTALRSKPAVPLGGKYRLIDIPISNAINSGLREIFVLTQYNSQSLNNHLSKTYRFDPFSQGFVEVLAAEQREESPDWYQGTADAIRRMLHHMERDGEVENVVILSGDHLYRMDYRAMLNRHREMEADITISVIPVTREKCEGCGVMAADNNGLVRKFVEKPKASDDITDLMAPPGLRRAWKLEDRPFLASMGVYVFRWSVLRELLADPKNVDFGKDVIPGALTSRRVASFLFDDYWEDIGTIKAFYESNLLLCEEDPPFKFYDEQAPIFTRPRFLPPTLLWNSTANRSVVAEGCVVKGAVVEHSIVGLRSHILQGTVIRDTILMGADHYQFEDKRSKLRADGKIAMGIGQNCLIERAIVDMNACIGDNVTIKGDPNRPDSDHGNWFARDGIVVIPKGAVIPSGTQI